jgi:hypothetical protein
MSLCKGDACVPPEQLASLPPCAGEVHWWTRVDPAGGGASKYYCATRRGHEDLSFGGVTFDVPATARWRWRASDEGTWEKCLQGCCETLGLN